MTEPNTQAQTNNPYAGYLDVIDDSHSDTTASAKQDDVEAEAPTRLQTAPEESIYSSPSSHSDPSAASRFTSNIGMNKIIVWSSIGVTVVSLIATLVATTSSDQPSDAVSSSAASELIDKTPDANAEHRLLQSSSDLPAVIDAFNNAHDKMQRQQGILDDIEHRLAAIENGTAQDAGLVPLKEESANLAKRVKTLEEEKEIVNRHLRKIRNEIRLLYAQIISLRAMPRAAVLPGWSIIGLTKTHVALLGPEKAIRVVKMGDEFNGVRFLSVDTDRGIVRTDSGELQYVAANAAASL